ncbi:C40 family peptidase [Herbaspirillum sp. RTI4]|uniref:C40 family peptidase n=1 Tax=Herbaspirillum sp. RTI4 TaxID=3048640 RepID=UPI002AB50185|nr:C40 family peptidase [Herbaspirillum sp. RTI4]MDY7578002.1 C40 family peptidase [Herbaspirillum sp. RTI4]MEA9982068.1 C40 family peptidase [Herbaspirillum sp. RTI4]
MATLLLSGCGGIALNTPTNKAPQASTPARAANTPPSSRNAAFNDKASDVVIYALGLLDIGYRFGGKNPDAGLDCSGMVTYVFREATGARVTGSAADIARQGKEIDKSDLRAGDLVFFNTQHRSFSHVGIYIGSGRFVHAPSTNGKIRIDRMDNKYFSARFEMARAYFD